jgi:glycosyltransferase involved in cell wall biosynthesis
MHNDNNNIPKVSIVLPTYNGSEYLAMAIESCLQQTYPAIELIIVDDHSTDSSAAIVASYAKKDDRIIVVTNDQNLKLPASLNKGFAKAGGDYFTWISDDNVFGRRAIETMINTFNEMPDADIVYSSYHFIDAAGKKLHKFNHAPEALLFKCAPGACFLYKRNVHTVVNGFDEAKFGMEDMDFWLKAAVSFKYKNIDQPDLYSYRIHTNSLTAAIHTRTELYEAYREHHRQSFLYFFNNALSYYPDEETLNLHVELYFEDIVKNKEWDFTVSEKIIVYMSYLDQLQSLDWGKTGFDKNMIAQVLNDKKRTIVSSVINDLVFENKKLQQKNPRIAGQLNKSLSWYYKEYEVLPAWYKKLGHIIKAMQGNRSWRSLIKREVRS